ncbi:hypothetical protein TWF696_007640 [Orbilia brochopaga]|uniref:Uncharacterized protein n=1 Tax=Orbilia brochopaga TaxID=3140254 RepID=A0AAV9ULX4_9PEZI
MRRFDLQTSGRARIDPVLSSASLSRWLWTPPSASSTSLHQLQLKSPIDAVDLDIDLDFSAFDIIQSSLFWAGRPDNFSPLHHYKSLRRDILATEKTHLHLVWFDETIFVKPLPLYLLNPAFYYSHIRPHPTFCPAARWLLYSYARLIAHPIDLLLAREHHLLPPDIEWNCWAPFAASLLEDISIDEFSGRFWYGALRLDRLNILCMLRMQPRGFFIDHHSKYGRFFQAKFKWLAITFFYISVLLASMQVVLATADSNGNDGADPSLGQNPILQRTFFWFGVLCMMLVVFSLVIVVTLFLLLFVWNFAATRKHHLMMKARRTANISTAV